MEGPELRTYRNSTEMTRMGKQHLGRGVGIDCPPPQEGPAPTAPCSQGLGKVTTIGGSTRTPAITLSYRLGATGRMAIFLRCRLQGRSLPHYNKSRALHSNQSRRQCLGHVRRWSRSPRRSQRHSRSSVDGAADRAAASAAARQQHRDRGARGMQQRLEGPCGHQLPICLIVAKRWGGRQAC